MRRDLSAGTVLSSATRILGGARVSGDLPVKEDEPPCRPPAHRSLLSSQGPLGLALGSPIFPSGCEGKLGVALESLQGLRDLT